MPTNNEPTLVGIQTCLEKVFPDEKTRPSIRTFNKWKQKGYFPSHKIGKLVFLDPVAVRKALDKRFVIEASKQSTKIILDTLLRFKPLLLRLLTFNVAMKRSTGAVNCK